MRVLVVDDSRTQAYMVAKMLKESGHEVVVAGDGETALAVLAEHPIDLLVIDWVLPNMNGPELASIIRQEFPDPYRYIIMVTAKTGHEYLVSGLRSGVDDYMEKPINGAELEARMMIGERIIHLQANLQRNLQAIQRVWKEWEATTNAIPQLICLLNYKGIVIHANQTLETWHLGYTKQLGDKTLYEILNPVFPDLSAYIERIWPIVKTRLLNKRHFEYEGVDSVTKHYFSVQFQPIQHDDDTSFEEGSNAFAAVNIQDITVRKRLELEIQEANKKSEELLLNILPEPIANRLKQGETNIAESYDNVTVLFADLVGFTKLTASIAAQDLIDLLNGVFSAFDYLTEQHKLEKIKTIGDSYMVVGGLPTPQNNHAIAVANMALDMFDAVQSINDISGHNLQVRIGIDSGTVIAGVIGQKKFIYDLWGDTVNTSSRMESTGEPGRVQVTETTYQLLKDHFRLEKRGELEVKGKGRMISYWLLGWKE